MSIEDFYTQSIEIKRETEPLDPGGSGKVIPTFSTIATVPGNIEDYTGDQYLKNEKRTYITTHICFMGVTDVQDNDRLIESGKTYRVHNIEDPIPHGHHYEIAIEKIT